MISFPATFPLCIIDDKRRGLMDNIGYIYISFLQSFYDLYIDFMTCEHWNFLLMMQLVNGSEFWLFDSNIANSFMEISVLHWYRSECYIVKVYICLQYFTNPFAEGEISLRERYFLLLIIFYPSSSKLVVIIKGRRMLGQGFLGGYS